MSNAAATTPDRIVHRNVNRVPTKSDTVSTAPSTTDRQGRKNTPRNSMDGLNKGALTASRPAGMETYWKSNYDVLEVLGKGSFGSVMRIQHKATSQVRVCKVVDTARLKTAEVSACLLEITALQRLDHPHIVRLYEYSLDRRDKKVYLILEALPGGDCKQFLKKPYEMLPEWFVSKVARQTLMAMSYCHSMGVVHRDMKPDNIMLTSKDKDTCTVKVIDFGLSAVFDPGRAHVIRQVAGTVYYMAPEVVSQEPFGDPADLWALGVTVYMLLCGTVPFDGRDVDSCRRAICNNCVKFPPRLGWSKRTQDSRNFIRALLQKEARDRPPATDVLSTQWIKAYEDAAQLITERTKRRTVGGLESFTQAKGFIQATLLLAAVQLTPGDLEEIERVFAAMDLDRDGFITAEELREVMTTPHAEPTPTHGGDQSSHFPKYSFLAGPEGSAYIQQIVCQADLNGNGVIDFSEFVAACLHARLMKSKAAGADLKQSDVLRYAFDCFDANGDGTVTEKEIYRMLDTPHIKRIEQQAGIDYKDALRGLPNNFAFTFDQFVEIVMSNVQEPAREPQPSDLRESMSDIADDEEHEHGQLDNPDGLFDLKLGSGSGGIAASASKAPSGEISKVAASMGEGRGGDVEQTKKGRSSGAGGKAAQETKSGQPKKACCAVQ